MDQLLLNTITDLLNRSRNRSVKIEDIEASVKKEVSGYSDFEVQKRLLNALELLEKQGMLKLPSRKGNGWNPFTRLPKKITIIRAKEDVARTARKEEIAYLRNRTAWEPARMAAFAHTLATKKQLEQAKAVNLYLRARREDEILIPHRERALRIFGNEKALDPYVRSGLFKGRITLKDLDCFFCPEPIPFQPLSFDPQETNGKPLLIVENANTYWSCCQANQCVGCFAAVVFGKGFKASNVQQAIDSLQSIEKQTGSSGFQYFGDLDPAGLMIPRKINQNRQGNGLSPVDPAIALYRALLEKGLETGYGKSQERYHDPEWARQWLGRDLADHYLKQVDTCRWPQEGLTAEDIHWALKQVLN